MSSEKNSNFSWQSSISTLHSSEDCWLRNFFRTLLVLEDIIRFSTRARMSQPTSALDLTKSVYERLWDGKCNVLISLQ